MSGHGDVLIFCINGEEIFNEASIEELRGKTKLLTACLEYCVVEKYGRANEMVEVCSEKRDEDSQRVRVHIITPSDPDQIRAQLSLAFSTDTSHVFQELQKRGVICNERKPSVIRVSPAPLYRPFQDVHHFMRYLDQAIETASFVSSLDKH